MNHSIVVVFFVMANIAALLTSFYACSKYTQLIMKNSYPLLIVRVGSLLIAFYGFNTWVCSTALNHKELVSYAFDHPVYLLTFGLIIHLLALIPKFQWHVSNNESIS